MSLYSMLKPNGPNGFGYGSTAADVTLGLNLEGKTILITGCNSGLGLEAMRVLRMRGAHVVGTARSEGKAREAGDGVTGVEGPFTGLACELADPTSVRACVAEVKKRDLKLDAIIANAGIMALPKLETAFGVELQLFTNHIGHFILITGLIDSLKEDGRVVMVSSSAHRGAPRAGIEFDNLSGERGYSPWAAYGQSKIANVLFAKELARKFAGTKRTANAVHPGVIRTNLGRHMGNLVLNAGYAIGGPLVLKTVGQGAATECLVAVSPKAAGINGEYFADCNVAKARADARDPELARRLWEKSEEIVAKLP